ncbi:MAG: PilZ domain-containing protein [Planctomycetes bacterium]|nr:PilZ domain-containing protein [Planctomycetota bacterium]
MSERSWSEHLVIVRLPPEPQTSDELDRVIQIAVNDIRFDIIVDFADVQTISQSSFCELVVLHRVLGRSSRRVGFCNMGPAIRSVFKTHKMGRIIETAWTKEISIKPSANLLQDGSVVLGNQDRNETPERRSCVRFNLSKSLRTTALLWRRSSDSDHLETVSPECWQCTLADVSEGGAQAVIDIRQEPIFRKGQYIVLRFSPVVCELPINFDALIIGILPTADSEHLCLGLQFVGLEANTKGRRSLQRLCDSNGRYFEALAYGADVYSALKPPIPSNGISTTGEPNVGPANRSR